MLRDLNGADVHLEDQVAVAAHTDLFMQGVTYGRVVKIGRKYVTIVATGLRANGREFRLLPEHLEVVPSAPWLK